MLPGQGDSKHGKPWTRGIFSLAGREARGGHMARNEAASVGPGWLPADPQQGHFSGSFACSHFPSGQEHLLQRAGKYIAQVFQPHTVRRGHMFSFSSLKHKKWLD